MLIELFDVKLKKMGVKMVLGFFVLMSMSMSVFSQELDYHYDFNVDYFPRILSLKYDTLSSNQIAISFEGEFIEALELVSKRILGEEKFVSRMSGFIMMSSGICPSQIRDAEGWIKIEIDRDGRLNDVKMYQNAGQINKSLSHQLLTMLQTAKINPAIKNGQSVNIRLYYIIESK